MRKFRSATATAKNVEPTSADVIRTYLEKQDVYKLHRPVRKRFAPYLSTVNNVKNMWGFDLLHVRTYAKYNNNYRHILSVVDVFSIFFI